MRVRVVRLGGFAGLALEATIDTADLRPANPEVEQALQALPWGRQVQPPLHPDQFWYQLTVTREGVEQSVGLREDEIPPQLQALLEVFEKQKQLRRR
jgi:hypothetical protein